MSRPQTHLNTSFFKLFLSVLLLSFDLLPSDTVGRFCSVWIMTHLNFRVTEKEQKKNLLSILNILTLVKNKQTTNICFF